MSRTKQFELEQLELFEREGVRGRREPGRMKFHWRSFYNWKDGDFPGEDPKIEAEDFNAEDQEDY